MKEFFYQIIDKVAEDNLTQIKAGVEKARGGGELASGDDLGKRVTTGVQLAMYIVGIVAVVILIVGGIQYATAAGDEKKVGTAKKTIIGAVIGLAVAILAWTIANFVKSAIN